MRIAILIHIIALFISGVQAQDPPKVVSTVSIIYDMVENIGGEFIDHEVIVPRGSDPHTYEPTPSDAVTLNSAELVFFNGLDFEAWLEDVVENIGKDIQTVTVANQVDAIRSQEYKGSADPHAWMDVQNAILYCAEIRDALTKALPQHETRISENYVNYTSKLKALDQEIKTRIQEIPADARLLITSHDAFSYYGKAYGLELYSLAGISTEAEPQTSDILRVTNVIRERKVPAVFVESTISPKLMQSLVKNRKTKVGGKLFADSLGPKDGKADTYIHMMRYNTETIVSALSVTLSEDETVKAESSNGVPMYVWILGGLALAAALYFLIR